LCWLSLFQRRRRGKFGQNPGCPEAEAEAEAEARPEAPLLLEAAEAEDVDALVVAADLGMPLRILSLRH
jgi:hypothetical protein